MRKRFTGVVRARITEGGVCWVGIGEAQQAHDPYDPYSTTHIAHIAVPCPTVVSTSSATTDGGSWEM